ASEDDHRQEATEFHDVRGVRHVRPATGVIPEAVQYHLIEGRADPTLRCFDQRRADVARVELQSVKVPRDGAGWTDEQDGSRMNVLLLLLHPFELKSRRTGQALDIGSVPGQEVPPLQRGFAAESGGKLLLLPRGVLRAFSG